jgi:transcriptional antiterminator RfaH
VGKTNWANAVIHVSRVRAPRPQTPPAKPVIEPTRIETDGLRWHALATQAKCELRVKAELDGLGYRAYCPLGAKFVFWEHTRRLKHKSVKQLPVFSRYIFVGLTALQVIGRHTVDKVIAVLSDTGGALTIPSAVIRRINDLELAYHWDETRSWREKSHFQVGSQARIVDGPLAGLYATVDEIASEERIRLLVELFGHSTPVELSACQIESA